MEAVQVADDAVARWQQWWQQRWLDCAGDDLGRLARGQGFVLTSAQAAGWFEDPKNALRHGDYVQLAAMLFDEPGVFDWLPSRAPAVRPPPHCGRHLTKVL